VYAEDWWSQQPIQFLLGPRFSVIREMMPAPDRLPGETFFMVGFTGSAFTNGARGLLDAAGRQYQMYGSSGPGGQPVLTIFVVPGNAPHG
jgi:hypothetical protein